MEQLEIRANEVPFNIPMVGPGRSSFTATHSIPTHSPIHPIHTDLPRHTFHINEVPDHRHSLSENRRNRVETMKLVPTRHTAVPYKPMRLAHWIPRRHLIPQVTARRRKVRKSRRRHTRRRTAA